MATLDSTHTSAFRAASRALDHAIEAAVAGEPTHASGTTFVPAELAEGRRLSMYRRLGPVSVFDGNGEETRHPRDYNRETVVALGLIGLAVLLLARRSRTVA